VAFEVIASGKQNLSGGQVMAFDFGSEARGKAQRVVDLMAELAD
jgi:hypothetical protein